MAPIELTTGSGVKLTFRNTTTASITLFISNTDSAASPYSQTRFYLRPNEEEHAVVSVTKRLWRSRKLSISCTAATGELKEKEGREKGVHIMKLGRRSRKVLVDLGAEGKRWVFQQRLSSNHYSFSIYQAREPSDWMASLSDGQNLSTVYLPGTHESLALHGFPVSSCQTFPILSQLERGMRFLDMRFSLKHGVLLGYHGLQNQYITAELALGFIYEFLEGHRQETVIVSIKQENAGIEFERKVFNLINQRKYLWYLDNRWPDLGEVRGKAVLFCRFGFTSGQGLHTSYWPDNKYAAWLTEVGQAPIIVQDWYSIGSFLQIPEKTALILSLFSPRSLIISPRRTQSLPPRINFCSGATLVTAFPFVVAKGVGLPPLAGVKGVNERVLDAMLRMKGEDRVAGDGGMILLLDYYEVPAGGSLVDLMIAWNYDQDS